MNNVPSTLFQQKLFIMVKSFRVGRSNRNRKKRTSGGSTSDGKPKSVAPTLGHEDVYFTTGSTKDAAAFQDTV